MTLPLLHLSRRLTFNRTTLKRAAEDRGCAAGQNIMALIQSLACPGEVVGEDAERLCVFLLSALVHS